MKNKKVYSFNNAGKVMHIKALTKKKIKEHFKVSNHVMTNYCSECSPVWLTYHDDKIDLDLTK